MPNLECLKFPKVRGKAWPLATLGVVAVARVSFARSVCFGMSCEPVRRMQTSSILALPEARLHSRSKLGRTHAHWKRKRRWTFSALIFWRSQRHTGNKTHKLFAWASVRTFSFRFAGVLFSFCFLFFRGMNVRPVRLSVQGRSPKTLSSIVFSVLFCFAASLGMVMVRLPVFRC